METRQASVIAPEMYQHVMILKLMSYELWSFFSAKNVLLAVEGSRAKLADFDAARRLHHELTEAGLKPLGTRGFVSPEVRCGIQDNDWLKWICSRKSLEGFFPFFDWLFIFEWVKWVHFLSSLNCWWLNQN